MTTTINKTKTCTYCDGSGEVPAMALVYPGEPHMADVGSADCPVCIVGIPEDEL